MPVVWVGERSFEVAQGGNLLEALLAAGVRVPHACRAGSCQVCQVRCVRGEPLDERPESLAAERRAEGWRLACQCRVDGDLQLEVFDPQREGQLATLIGHDWLSPQVLRLRLAPQLPLRYQAGQHLTLWSPQGTARPYSLASLAGEDAFLEFHLQCAGGAFCGEAAQWREGQALRLGPVQGGALHYDPSWQDRPLYLLASGTGLAPLWAVLREALRQGHAGPIELLHLATEPAEHYLRGPLEALATGHPQLRLEFALAAELPAVLARLRLVPRRAIALVCGGRAAVESLSRQLFLAGVPRAQVFRDEFLTAGEAPA